MTSEALVGFRYSIAFKCPKCRIAHVLRINGKLNKFFSWIPFILGLFLGYYFFKNELLLVIGMSAFVGLHILYFVKFNSCTLELTEREYVPQSKLAVERFCYSKYRLHRLLDMGAIYFYIMIFIG